MRGLVMAAVLAAGPAWAQDQVWLQLEALPTLSRAQDAAEGYAESVQDVGGFYLGSGWYGVVVGPLPRADAQALLARLVAQGEVPRDSFIADGSTFRDRFWPAAGTDPATEPAPEPVAEPTVAVAEAPPVAAPTPAAIPDETPAEAAASEAALPQAEKERLQVALAWAGVYEGGIDGAFGRGTRAAMAAWQQRQGHEPTGVLTARERAELVAAYNAPIASLGLQPFSDPRAGVAVMVPAAVVGQPVTEPPFIRFDALDGGPAQVVLISTPGDADRLAGLYEIMQTLEMVPPDGPRERTDDAFAIEGQDARVHATVYAWLVDDAIKGFALVWPAGDEERRARLVAEMQASFRLLPGALDPGSVAPSEDQSVDLVSGLAVRQPLRTASGFYVDGMGTAVTTAAAVEDCASVTLDDSYDARVAGVDERLGLAILEPLQPLAPRAVAAFRPAPPRLGSEVAVAGYPYGAALAQPALTFGRVEDLRGLDGEVTVRRLSLSPQAGDAGGPVLDEGGAVMGMLMPPPDDGSRALPPDVHYALDAGAILDALAAQGIRPATAAPSPTVSPERLTREAAELAVLVSCW